MVNLFLTPLGPGLILLLGALALAFVRHTLPPLVSRIMALASLIGAGVLMFPLGGDQENFFFLSRFVRPWDPVTLPGGIWFWQVDGWGWLTMGVLLLLGLVAILLAWDEPQAGRAPALATTLLLLSAASFFVFSANLLTLTASWVIVDVALGLRVAAEGRGVEGADGRVWGLNGLGAVLLLGALLFAGPEGARQPLTGGKPLLSVLALLLAAMLRSGAYPFHMWVLPQQGPSRSGMIAWHLIAPLTGLWLLGRVHSLAGSYWLFQPAWAAMAVLGLLGSGLAAWLAREAEQRYVWVVINRMSLAVLAATLTTEKGPATMAWPLTMLALGWGSLLVGQAISQRWGWRQPLGLGVLTLIGLPGTPGFPARCALAHLATMSLVFSPLWVLALLTETLLVAALLCELIRRPQLPVPSVPPGAVVRLLACVVLLAVPLLIWGLQPPFLARLAGLPAQAPGFQPLLTQLREATGLTWVSLLLPWLGGGLLAWQRERILAGLQGWQRTASQVASLEWGYGAVQRAVEGTAAVLRGVAGVLEGEGYLGWLGLAVLLAWLLWNL